ncbi:MAG TPA: CdaR family protein [Trueperaceae bacterium]|nr:CdaR family protein [Trueperaceae bacterium]
MTGLAATLKALLQRLTRNWVPKAGSLVIAFLIWLFVTSSSASLTERSMFLPLQVDGVEEGFVPVGLPPTVAVSVSGPSLRVDRLTPDMLRASLDLTGTSGEFTEDVRVQAPQDIRVLRVEPAEVIGFLETITTSTVAVTVALTGDPPAGVLVEAEAEPAAVTLTGRSQVLDRVARVLAFAPAVGGGVARLVAVDAAGVPVPDVEFAPASVTVSVSTRPALVTREVVVELSAPSGPEVGAVTLNEPRVTVAGPPDVLAGLSSVPGTVDAPTGPLDPGRYTLPVRLALPEGVVAMQIPTATLQYVRQPLAP